MGKKSLLAHLLDPSNVVDYEFNIFLSKEFVTDITTQNFGFGYTTAYVTQHHGYTPFAVPSFYPSIMVQLDIDQQAQDRSTIVTVAEKKNTARGPCNGSVCPCTQTEEWYVCTCGQKVYLRYQTTRTTSLANLLIQTTPPGTPFTASLHGILPVHGPTPRYGYV